MQSNQGFIGGASQRLVGGVVVIALMVTCDVPALAQSWKAGVGRAIITPPQFMPMAGYAARGAKHCESKLTDLWAKALVLEDAEGDRGVLVTMDLIGIDRPLSQEVCRALQEQFGLRRDQIVLSFSHTHTGPVVAGNLRPMHAALFDAADQKLVADYAAFFKGQVLAAVRSAIDGLAPAEISWGSGTATFAVNRRENAEKDVPQLREQGQLKGPFDHDVPVLVVRRGDKLIAVAFGYACHNTTLSSFEWAGDYAGFAQQDIEAAQPGVVAMYWTGCGADQNPIPRRTVELARQYGRELSDAVQAVLKEPMQQVDADLQTTYQEIDLAFAATPTREQLVTDSQATNQPTAARAKAFLETLDAGQAIETTYPYPIARWELGDDVDWVFLGGEVVVDYALRIKQDQGDADVHGTNVWVGGYANDVMAYIPSLRVLVEGGYEGATAMVYYGRPSPSAQDIEDRIIREVQQQAALKP